MKTGLLLLARMGSTRLPGKLLLEVMERPILEYQIQRLKTAQRPDCLVLCTTQLAEDNVLVDLAARSGIQTFRGSTDDVVERMIQAARDYQLDFVVSIGGDDILSDAGYADRITDRFYETGAEFIYCPDLPMGTSPYGVKPQALERLSQLKTGGTDGWERYLQETGVFQVERVPVNDPTLCRPELRITLDYSEDFEFFKTVLETLHPQDPSFSLKDVIDLVDRSPDLAELGRKRADEWYSQRARFDISVNADAARGPKERG